LKFLGSNIFAREGTERIDDRKETRLELLSADKQPSQSR